MIDTLLGKVKTANIDYVDTYRALEKVYKKGKAKAIGYVLRNGYLPKLLMLMEFQHL